MCVKLPSVSEWGGIALTDGLAVNTGHIYCYTGVAVRYANRTKRRTKRGEIAKETKKTKTLTDERNDSRWHQRATKSHHGRDRNTSAHAVFGCSSCSCFPPLFVLPTQNLSSLTCPLLLPPSFLQPSTSISRSRSSCSHPITECFAEDLTPRGYCVRKMILISALTPPRSHANYRFALPPPQPHGERCQTHRH